MGEGSNMNTELSASVEQAFSEEFDRIPLFLGSNVVPVLEDIQRILSENCHLLCVTGQPGSGRTALIRELQRRLRRDLISIVYAPTPGALLFDLLQSFGIVISERDETVARRRLCMSLASAHQTEPMLQIIDDADRLQPDDFQLLLHLFGKGFAQIILVGSPELPARLAENQVVADRGYRLAPFQLSDTGPYIRHRLHCAQLPEDLFRADAVAAIYAYSGGSPRLVNKLCSAALSTTDHAGTHTVTESSIHAAARMADAGTYRYLPIAQPVVAAAKPKPPESVADDLAAVEIEPPEAAVDTSENAVPRQVQAKGATRSTRPANGIWRDAAVVAAVAITALLLQGPLIEWSERNSSVADLSRLWASIKAPEPAVKPVEQPASLITIAVPEPVNVADFAALQPAPPVDGEIVVVQKTDTGQTDNTAAEHESATARTGDGSVPRNNEQLSPEQLAEVARLYAVRAEYEIGKGDLAAARISIDRGLASDGNNKRLLALRRDLDQFSNRAQETPPEEDASHPLPAPRASISPTLSQHYQTVLQDAEVRFYVKRTRAALAAGDPQAALASVEAGLDTAPDDRRLLELRDAALATLGGRQTP